MIFEKLQNTAVFSGFLVQNVQLSINIRQGALKELLETLPWRAWEQSLPQCCAAVKGYIQKEIDNLDGRTNEAEAEASESPQEPATPRIVSRRSAKKPRKDQEAPRGAPEVLREDPETPEEDPQRVAGRSEGEARTQETE